MLEHIHGTPVFMCDVDGPKLRGEADALDLIVQAGHLGAGASWLVLPESRLEDDFFELSTRIAGAIVQKFVTYEMGFAVIGDISRHTDESVSLAAFVRECNRGRHTWFVADREQLDQQFAKGVGWPVR
jgi:hypothetical protein